MIAVATTLCCQLSGLDFEAAGVSVACFCLSASSRCKHDMQGRSYIAKYETNVKNAHPPLWQTCKVLCPWALFRIAIEMSVDQIIYW